VVKKLLFLLFKKSKHVLVGMYIIFKAAISVKNRPWLGNSPSVDRVRCPVTGVFMEVLTSRIFSEQIYYYLMPLAYFY